MTNLQYKQISEALARCKQRIAQTFIRHEAKQKEIMDDFRAKTETLLKDFTLELHKMRTEEMKLEDIDGINLADEQGHN